MQEQLIDLDSLTTQLGTVSLSGEALMIPEGALYLEIEGFRKLGKRKILFPRGMNNIMAPNGHGKSSIFAAIAFVIYGASQGVYAPGTSGDRKRFCKGLLVFSGLLIRREKNPEILSVLYNGISYSGEAAQSIIESVFVPEALWDCSCFIEQGTLNPFMTAAASERMNIIKKLSAKLPASQQKRELLKNTSIEKQRERDMKTAIYQANVTSYNLQSQKLKGVNCLPKEEVDRQLEELSKERAKLESSKASEIRRSELTKLLKQYPSPFPEPEKPDDELQMKLMTELELLKRDLQAAQENQRLKASLVPVEEAEKVEAFEVEKARQAEFEYQNAVNSFARIGFPYNSASLEAAIKDYEEKLILAQKDQTLSMIYSQLQSTKAMLSTIVEPPKVVTPEEVEKLKKEIQLAEAGLTILTCPSCSTSLRNHNGCLVQSDYAPSTQNKLMELRSQLATAMNLQNVAQQREQLKKTVEQLSTALPENYTPSGINLQYTSLMLSELKKLKFVEKPQVSCQELSTKYFKYEKYKEFLAKKSLVKDLPEPSFYETRIAEINMNLQKIAQNRVLRNTYDAYVSLKSQYDLLPEPYTGLDEQTIASKMNWLLYQLSLNKELQSLNEKYHALVKEDQELREFSRKVSALVSLERKSPYAECLLLEKTANDINEVLTEILTDVFSKPISVSVEMFKENSTSGSFVPNLNFKIVMDSVEYRSYKELSVGERSLVSISLAVAIAKRSRSNLFIMDELASNVDAKTKPALYAAVKKHLGDRVVLVVDHALETDPEFNNIQLSK